MMARSRLLWVSVCSLLVVLITTLASTAQADDPTPTPTATPAPCSGDARYWVGGAGSAADAAHWACTSGGPGGAAPPDCVAAGDAYQSSNDCIWDASSSLAATASIDTTGLCCRLADWSAVALDDGHAAGRFSDGFFVSGSLVMGAGIEMQNSAGPLVLTATAGEHSLTITTFPYGVPPSGGIDLHGSGTYGDHAVWNLAADTGWAATFTLGYGTLQLNGYRLNVENLLSSHGELADAFTLDFGDPLPAHDSPVIWVSNTFSVPNTTIEAAHGMVRFNGAGMFPDIPESIFNAPDQSYSRVQTNIFDGGNWLVNGLITMGTLVVNTQLCSAVPEICHTELERGTTASMTVGALAILTVNDWQVGGSSALPLIMQSATPGVPWTLNCTSDAPCASDYIVLSDSTCSTNIPCYAGSHSTDNGGNTNWVFSDPPPAATPTPVACNSGSDFCAVIAEMSEGCGACLCGEGGIVSNCEGENPSSTVCADEVACVVTDQCTHPCPMSAACAAALATTCGTAAQCNCAPTPTPLPTPIPCESNDRFWVGGGGRASEQSHWACSSGGPGGASVPACVAAGDTFQGVNNCIFDDGSGLQFEDVIDSAGLCCVDVDTRGVLPYATEMPNPFGDPGPAGHYTRARFSKGFYVSGSFQQEWAQTEHMGNRAAVATVGFVSVGEDFTPLTLTASSGTHALSIWELPPKGIDFHGSGTYGDAAIWELASDWPEVVANQYHAGPISEVNVVFRYGRLNMNARHIQASDVLSEHGSDPLDSFILDTGDTVDTHLFDIRHSWAAAVTFVPRQWSIQFTEIATSFPTSSENFFSFNPLGLSYSMVSADYWYCGTMDPPVGELHILGDAVIDTLYSNLATDNVTSACVPRIIMQSGSTMTVAHWNVNGVGGTLLRLLSSGEEPWTLSCQDETCISDYLDVTNSICTGNTPCYAGVNSTVDPFSLAHGWSTATPPSPTPTPTPAPASCTTGGDFCALSAGGENCGSCLCGESGILSNCDGPGSPTSTVCADEVECAFTDNCAHPCPMSEQCAAALAASCSGQCNCEPTPTPTPAPVSCDTDADFCAVLTTNFESCVGCLCGGSGIVSNCDGGNATSTVCADELACVMNEGCPCTMSAGCAAAIAESCGTASQCYCATPTPTPCTGGARYWVGGAGTQQNHADWNDPANWSLSSGGSGGAAAPGCVAAGDTYQGCNDVIFDANSGIAEDAYAYIGFDHACAQNFDTSAATGLGLYFERQQGQGATELVISGDVQTSNITHVITGVTKLTANAGTHDYFSTAVWMGDTIDFHGTGQESDNAVWRMRHWQSYPTPGDVDPRIVFGHGTLDATECVQVGPYPITVIQGFEITGGATPGAFTIIPAGNQPNNGPPVCEFRAEEVWNPGPINIVAPENPSEWRLTFVEIGSFKDAGCWAFCPHEYSNVTTFAVGGQSYDRVWVNFDSCCREPQPPPEGSNNRDCTAEDGTAIFRVTGGGTIGKFGDDDPGNVHTTSQVGPLCIPVVEMESDTAYSVENWALAGSEGAPLTIRASTSGVAWTLNCTNAHACFTDYVNLSDSICIGTTPCYAGAHSTVDAFSLAHGWEASAPPPPPPTPTPTPVSCASGSDFCAVVNNGDSCGQCLCGESGIINNCDGGNATSTVCADEVACILNNGCPCTMSAECAAAIAANCAGSGQCNCEPTPTPPPAPVDCDSAADFCAVLTTNFESCVGCLCGGSGIISNCDGGNATSTVCADELACVMNEGCPCTMSAGCAAAIAASCGEASQCYCATPTPEPTPCTSGARYWVGGAGTVESHADWNDSANWALTSGGSGGASPPACVAAGDTYQGCNDVIFDANSGIGSGVHAYITFDRACAQNFDTTEVGGEMLTFERDPSTAATELIVSGSFATGGKTNLQSMALRLTASEGTHDFNSQAKWMGAVVDFHGTGTSTDHAVWRMRHWQSFPYQGDVDPILLFGNGTLDATECIGLGDQSGDTIQSVDMIGSAGFTLIPAGGSPGNSPSCDFRPERLWSPGALTIVPPDEPNAWRINYIEIGAFLSAGCTIGNCPVPYDATATFDAGNLTYDGVAFNFDNCCNPDWRDCSDGQGPATFRVTGGGTIDTFGTQAPSTSLAQPGCTPGMEVQSDTEYTVRQWNVRGTDDKRLPIKATTPGVPWTLKCTNPVRCESDYIDLHDSICSETTPCYAGVHSSVDSFSLAHGWTTDAPPPLSCESDADLCSILTFGGDNCGSCLCGESGIITDCGGAASSTQCADEVTCIVNGSCPCLLSATCANAISASCGSSTQCNCAPTPTPTPTP